MVSRNTERFKNKYGFYSYSRVINMVSRYTRGGGKKPGFYRYMGFHETWFLDV